MKATLLTVVFLFLTHSSFSQEVTKTFDPKLIGCWKGSETDQQIKGLSKYWVSCRSADGTSTLLYVAIDRNGEVTQETENGKWWVENGKYHELHNVDGVTDIYSYEVIGDSIKFKSIEMLGRKDDSYVFFDYKIEEDY